MAVLAVFFKLIHWFYATQFDPVHGLAGPVTHRFDFIILTLATLTEPDPLPWFPKASAGNGQHNKKSKTPSNLQYTSTVFKPASYFRAILGLYLVTFLCAYDIFLHVHTQVAVHYEAD